MALFEREARLCQALADPKRLAIIHLLRDGERSVSELVAALGVRQPNVSQHLMILRELGVVSARRAGNVMHYRLKHPAIGQACELVRQVLAEQYVVEGDDAEAWRRARRGESGRPDRAS